MKQTLKELKADIKHIWQDQIRTAIYYANEAAKNADDNGSCNFDMAMIYKEKHFTYAETIEIFRVCGINACKATDYSRFYTGLVALPNYVGQANRNTVWAETFAKWLKEQGFKTSMYYQCD